MKLSKYSAISLALMLFISSLPTSFGETGREVFLVEKDNFDNCWDECNDDDYNHNGNSQFLEASFLGGNLIQITLPPSKDMFNISVSMQAPNHFAPGAIYFKIPIDNLPSSNLFNDVKINKAEFQFLALPLQESEDQNDIYSGKLISSLFLCDSIYEHSHSFHCDYSIRPIDTITVNTEELPNFLVYDITPVIERAGNKELFLAIENKPIEDLNDLDEMDFVNFFFKNHEEIYNYDYGVGENTNVLEQVSPTKIPEIFSEALDQPIRKLYVRQLNFEFARENSNNPESRNSNPITFHIEPDYATFFIVPASNNRELSTSSVIVDYEILDSDLSKAFTYFLGFGLPSIAILIPVIIWLSKKKSK